eukprot:2768293-Pyramimonas_sp.AAC.1
MASRRGAMLDASWSRYESAFSWLFRICVTCAKGSLVSLSFRLGFCWFTCTRRRVEQIKTRPHRERYQGASGDSDDAARLPS